MWHVKSVEKFSHKNCMLAHYGSSPVEPVTVKCNKKSHAEWTTGIPGLGPSNLACIHREKSFTDYSRNVNTDLQELALAPGCTQLSSQNLNPSVAQVRLHKSYGSDLFCHWTKGIPWMPTYVPAALGLLTVFITPPHCCSNHFMFNPMEPYQNPTGFHGGGGVSLVQLEAHSPPAQLCSFLRSEHMIGRCVFRNTWTVANTKRSHPVQHGSLICSANRN